MVPLFLISALLVPAQDFTKPKAVAPLPREVRSKVRFIRGTMTYVGEAMEVDSHSITVRGKEEGNLAGVVIRTFPAGPALLRGEQDPQEARNSDYRLEDVKVGDKVFLKLKRGEPDEEAVCLTVAIVRRPGGLVPRAPFEDPYSSDPHHVVANAWQAFEERGLPLPLKYDPEYKQLENEASKARYLSMREKRMREYEKKAPPPRPVVRK
jgi:hypothetical protein